METDLSIIWAGAPPWVGSAFLVPPDADLTSPPANRPAPRIIQPGRGNSLKVRFLGDRVLQRTAWRVADELGWETTYDAEFVALTQLQADIFVTSDAELARAVSGLVETATIDALRTA